MLTAITSVSFIAQTKEEKEAKKKADRELKLEMGKDLFESVYTAFSSKKISTVTLKDGRIIQGYKTGIKQKSGLILSIEIEDSISKKRKSLQQNKFLKCIYILLDFKNR
ncbi:hypothetical protein O2K51_10360 [Apibacter raozihei]|uniref:hypothetical protein n=1 Tax=Apibacter raozihei TaxID=2500547 RepID=UPI000FE2F865|nr:hypothetical protein [Apibacter raozihei]